jgi:hypothetical protein
MTDQYYIDLERFSLERFKNTLEAGELLPGRRILKEKIPERFAILESMGIKNLKDLTHALNTKQKVERFSQESGLPNDYLIILRREANRYKPKPANLSGFPEVDPEYIERLAAMGIKHTKHLFDRARASKDRAELSRQARIPLGDLLEIVKLSSLVRVSGVGPVFARMLYEAGIDTLEKLSDSSADQLFERLLAVNEEGEYTKADFSTRDVQYCISMAKELPKAIEY